MFVFCGRILLERVKGMCVNVDVCFYFGSVGRGLREKLFRLIFFNFIGNKIRV